MKLRAAVLIVATTITCTGGAGLAHHSFVSQFDSWSALTLHGVVTDVQMIHPHSFISLDVKAEGGVERWLLEGPGPLQIARMGRDGNFIKAGHELGVCGYPAKADVMPAGARHAGPRGARTLQAAVLIMPDGQKLLWSNYRQGKCGLDQ